MSEANTVTIITPKKTVVMSADEVATIVESLEYALDALDMDNMAAINTLKVIIDALGDKK